MSNYARPNWHEYFLGIAEAVSARADCRRRKVGAVIIDPDSKVVLATGYNGTVRGAAGCLAGACPRGLLSYDQQPAMGDYSNCISKHAEVNAHSYLERSSRGLWMYVNQKVCPDCLSFLRDRGYDRVYWPSEAGSYSHWSAGRG